jgi:phosphopantetheinyl transferase (holo-ACP synthase)
LNEDGHAETGVGPFVASLVLPGPPRGLGVDLVGRGRVSARLAERHFAVHERDRPELAFAVREAVIKAVGGVGIPGAPLADMGAERRGETLVFVPGPRYAPVLARKRVAHVVLLVLPFDEAGVLAIACGEGEPTEARCAVCLERAVLGDADRLGPAERTSVLARFDPLPSIANRLAARTAARLLGVNAAVSVEGGGALRPELAGDGLDGALLSLGHERDWGVAAVLLRGF